MNDYIIDFESFSNKCNARLIDLSCIVFEEDINNPPKFMDLVNSGVRVKFDLKQQKSRHILQSTIDWWREQSPEAKKLIKPCVSDVSILSGIQTVMDYLRSHNIDYWKSLAWCRGNSFDFPIFENILCELYSKDDTIFEQPVNFSRQRCIRTAIEQNLGRMQIYCPLPKGTLDGFIMHNSLHDCAKDILMLIYSKRYSYGLDEIPTLENTDINSIKKG